MLYDIPGRTGRKIATPHPARVWPTTSQHRCVKDAPGDPAGTALSLSEAPTDFEVYSGDDSCNLALLAIGAVGVVGVATHWAGLENARWSTPSSVATWPRPAESMPCCMQSFAYEDSDAAPNPVPAKAMMRVLGLPVGPGPAPMMSCPRASKSTARAVMAPLVGRYRADGRRLMTDSRPSITFLGGLGDIGRNCAAIEIRDR